MRPVCALAWVVAALSATPLVAAVSEGVSIRVIAERDRNLLRNGSFEFANRYNGMRTILDQGDVLAHTRCIGQNLVWCDLGLEQWWGEGVTNCALFAVVSDACSGERALAIKSPGAATTWLAYVEKRPLEGIKAVTLSLKVKGGRAKVSLSLYEGAAGLGMERKVHDVECFASGQNGSWRQGKLTMEIPQVGRELRQPAFCVSIAAVSDEITVDDVQLEYGNQATGYSEQQSHYLSMRMKGGGFEDLPKYRSDGRAADEIVVQNTSGRTLTGLLELYLDAWDCVPKTRIARLQCVDWRAGEEKSFSIQPGKMRPNGYVVIASFEPYFGKDGVFTTENTGWGKVGKSALLKRNGFRFAVFPETKPQELFGVGNGMVGHDGWWGGNSFANAVQGKSICPVLLGEADPFKAAIIGAPNILETGFNRDFPKDDPEVCNPASPHQVNAYSPSGRRAIAESARRFARRAADDPSVAGAKLENEGFFVNRSDFCPDRWADLDYRNWLKRRYSGSLDLLNAAWLSSYTAWDDVRQPISGMKAGTVQKTGGAAIDWTASMGKMTKEAQVRLNANRAASLDWFRWRADSVVRVYGDYMAVAKTIDKKTLYGNNYPWPNYFTHVIWPQWRTHDVIMLDQQYVCGFSKTLGTNEEMIDILEQAESISRGERPIWGREIYFQPSYPGEMAALQNWAMIAHGMSVPMTFAWRPYADYNREIFRTGNRSWLKEGAPPMWFLIDTDGTPVPGYEPNRRSTDEIATFHRKYDGHSLKRIRGDVALYYSRDESAYIMLETFDKPYESVSARNRAAIAAALRMAGSRIEYFDDETLSEVSPDKFPVLIAPGERVVGEKSIALLRRYVARGGKFIALNDFNTLDVCLRPKGKPGLAGWKGFTKSIAFNGKYAQKPYNTAEYDNELRAFFRENAFIPRHAWWENDVPRQPGEESLLPGEGRPVVEVVVRRQEKSGTLFVFVLNKGGSGRGRLCGEQFESAALSDAFTGEPVATHFELPAFGYRILTLRKQK